MHGNPTGGARPSVKRGLNIGTQFDRRGNRTHPLSGTESCRNRLTGIIVLHLCDKFQSTALLFRAVSCIFSSLWRRSYDYSTTAVSWKRFPTGAFEYFNAAV